MTTNTVTRLKHDNKYSNTIGTRRLRPYFQNYDSFELFKAVVLETRLEMTENDYNTTATCFITTRQSCSKIVYVGALLNAYLKRLCFSKIRYREQSHRPFCCFLPKAYARIFITCSAVILDTDWSEIVVLLFKLCRFNTEHLKISICSQQFDLLLTMVEQVKFVPPFLSSVSYSTRPSGIWMTSGGYHAGPHFQTGRIRN